MDMPENNAEESQVSSIYSAGTVRISGTVGTVSADVSSVRNNGTFGSHRSVCTTRIVTTASIIRTASKICTVCVVCLNSSIQSIS